MTSSIANAESLIEEYGTLILESTKHVGGEVDWEAISRSLSETAEWTDLAAVHLVDLARNYGVFMLRNALALAVAAGIEDGKMGF